jgi:predicted peptidase
MGGFGTWQAAYYRPNTIAALVPICGGGDTSKVSTFAQLPVWMFHGEKDNVIPVQLSLSMFEATRLARGKGNNKKTLRLTLYPEANHNCWDNAFAERQLLKWLFRQHK